MIITCDNCSKKFDIDQDLIPDKGRLLQCSVCDHKWFFKKKIVDKSVSLKNVNDSKSELAPFEEKKEQNDKENRKTIDLLNNINENNTKIEKSFIQKDLIDDEFINKDKDPNIKPSTNERNYNILSLIIVFIISFIGLIIFFDTFQGPISKIIPNFEFILYNLYETINDVQLFLKDLI